MDAAVAAADLAARTCMTGDSVILWEGGGGDDDRVGWSEEDCDAAGSDWSSKTRRNLTSRPNHSRGKKVRLSSVVEASAISSSARADSAGEPELSFSRADDLQAQAFETFNFQVPTRVTSTGGLLQKHISARSNSCTTSVVAETGACAMDSSLGNGGGFPTLKTKGTGSIFFKTKLCCKFRAGTCPYNSNCNFAHGMEELRKPPPGWEEMVAAQEAERAARVNNNNQIHVIADSDGGVGQGDSQRSQKTPRPCRKFYTEDGCPYGDRCIFVHDEQLSQGRALRESNAISLGPMGSQGMGSTSFSGSGDKSSSLKARICHKWETTGHCPFGQKCHFLHGNADGFVHTSTVRHGGTSAVATQMQRQGAKAQLKWKGQANEISTIYGDWIEEDEWESIVAA